MITNIASVPRNVAPRLASNRSSDATKQTLDPDLIRRIALGNKLALQVLYMRHNVRLFRFALRFVHNKDAAKEGGAGGALGRVAQGLRIQRPFPGIDMAFGYCPQQGAERVAAPIHRPVG